MSIKEKLPEFFKSVKTSLKSILKHPDINTPKIQDTVIKVNKRNSARYIWYDVIGKNYNIIYKKLVFIYYNKPDVKDKVWTYNNKFVSNNF